MSQEWSNGLCGCFSPLGTCCMGTWCPCILYGKTRYRLQNNGDMNGYSCCNGCCCAYCLLMSAGLNGIMQIFQRGDIRKQLNLEGGCCTDCLKSCCCSCCALIQEEKEVSEKTGSSKHAHGYAAPGQMTYG